MFARLPTAATATASRAMMLRAPTTTLSAPLAAPLAATVQKRFASDKAIRTRMVAVGNIKKITRAMKMVASAKLRRCEEALTVSRSYAQGLLPLWESKAKEGSAAAKEAEAAAAAAAAAAAGSSSSSNTFLFVPITPDRGLCGSVSGQVNRLSRARLNTLVNVQQRDVRVVTYGEKSRASLERLWSKTFAAVVTEHSKLKRRTFKQSMLLADVLLKQNFESAEIVFNEFKNLISFETRTVPLLSYSQAVADPKLFEPFELEGNPDLLENLYELSLAIRLNAYLSETDMVEFSQRVNSMGNSSKSAEDMLSRLKLLYNRSRQARITTELVEIISGAVAAEDGVKEK